MRRTMPDVTVLVNTYNRRDRLERVLLAYQRQTRKEFEVVVADDGSNDGTDRMVARLRGRVNYDLRYVRHARRGARRAATLNLGIAEARGRLVLFTDCDSLPRANLVAVHRRRSEPGRLLVGGYVRLSARQTDTMTEEDVLKGRYERHLDEAERWRLRMEHAKIQMYIAMRRKRRPHNMGLNYSVWRNDLVAINGYDEMFRGWGCADGDVRDRLRDIDVLPKSAWADAVVYHLWHPPQDSKHEYVAGRRTRNQIWARRRARETRCLRGLEKLPGWKTQAAELKVLVNQAQEKDPPPKVGRKKRRARRRARAG
jgi:glycosyltransferase involved in cell wall biosynthesis